MREQKSERNISRGETNSKRRDFLTHSLVGGLSLTLISAQPILAGTDLSAELCSAKPATSDALTHYYKMMSDIQAGIHLEVIGEWVERTKACNRLFDELRTLVEQLETAVHQPEMRTQVKQMRDLTEIGRTQAKMMNAHATSTDTRALVKSITLVSQQVGETAQDLLPTGKNELGAEASRILNQIVKLVKESIPRQQAQITETQRSTNELLNALRKNIKSVEGHLDAAREAAVVADNPLKSPREIKDARVTAAGETDKAITELGELKATAIQQCGGKCSDATQNIDDLVMFLEGIREWIKAPDKVLAFNSNMDPAGNATASLRQTRYAHPVRPETLGNIFSRHCPPGSQWQVASCTTFVLAPLKGWAWFRRPSQAQKINAVESGVRKLFSCSARALAEDIVNSSLL